MWPVLQCLARGTIQTTLVVSHVSQNCSDLTCLSNLFHCCARVRCWVKLTVSAGNWRWWAALYKVVNLRGKKKQKSVPLLWHQSACSAAEAGREQCHKNTLLFIGHFVQLHLCHGHWKNPIQQAIMAASTWARTHNHTEKGLVLHFPQKQLQHENKRNGLGKDRDSLCLIISMNKGRFIHMFLQHNEILNPLYPMSSDSFPVFILEAFPLPPPSETIWAFDPVETLWQAYLRKDDIVLQQVYSTTRSLRETVLKMVGGYCSHLAIDLWSLNWVKLDPYWTGWADTSVVGCQINSDLRSPTIWGLSSHWGVTDVL